LVAFNNHTQKNNITKSAYTNVVGHQRSSSTTHFRANGCDWSAAHFTLDNNV